MAKMPVKLVYRSKPIVMAIVMVLVIGATIGVVTVHNALDNSMSQYDAMRLHAAALESANAKLTTDISSLGSIESAIRIAEEELGLVYPDTIVFTPAND